MTLKQDKVKENLKKLSAQFIERESNHLSLITVMDANVSIDLKRATLFVSVLPESSEESALNFLKRQRSELREYLKKKMDSRSIPFLDFEIDMGEKNRQRIDELSHDL
ncbi:MAG: ribosome-binding factor A [Patescibacteria group bacterium]